MRPDLRTDWSRADRAWLWVAGGVYVPMVVLGGLWMVTRHEGPDASKSLMGDAPLEGLIIGIFAGLGLHLSMRATERWRPMRALNDALADHTHDMQPRTQALVAILSGFGEEVLFRGVLQSSLGLVGATLCFAVVHVPVERRMLPWPLVAGAAGLFFGYITILTGGVLAACIGHALSNALSLRRLSASSLRASYDANTLQPRL